MKKQMLAICSMAVVGMALAGTPTSFAYQGVLRDATGAPLSQEQATITFRLYNSNADKASVLWEKELDLAIDTNGLFNAELTGGALAKVIADAEENGQSLYVGLTVKGSAGEISPRQRMIPTPVVAYAQNVAKADGDFTVKGTVTFDGEVSMSGSDKTFKAGNIDASGGLTTSGTAALNGGTTLKGEVNVTGDMTVSDKGRLMVKGAQMSLPIGMIAMWVGSSADIPTNCWALCDGTTEYQFNGKQVKVPDLRGRFIVGSGSRTDAEGNSVTYKPGNGGGVSKHTLTKDEMPSHAHTIDKGKNQVLFKWADHNVFGDDSQNHSTGNYDTLGTGGNQAHENRPPYYALCYIIKIK